MSATDVDMVEGGFIVFAKANEIAPGDFGAIQTILSTAIAINMVRTLGPEKALECAMLVGTSLRDKLLAPGPGMDDLLLAIREHGL